MDSACVGSQQGAGKKKRVWIQKREASPADTFCRSIKPAILEI